ncbi:ankyrin repeat domain-containing protein [Leptospira stimsonii]|uniref:Ankyrin repeat domain-containing protein n=1 Tax=Leptospira stimsonii TaxID=2202203 RepID=A0A4R9L605_9LEPT|nr:ankyrin repeat domain-containing protein [Leptospira stimsonii]RHX86440.1 ankyrin repeat domain-containing protein [Leptospira stimsonii]TGK14443.1 ankyrin repeat domain-containing protein [Leptospira stimsonii]TGM11806.1 ankyrin repeat domain-containing protein [Leptospira stimsonii]
MNLIDSKHSLKAELDSSPTYSNAWGDYKKTINLENSCFDFARRGDLEELSSHLPEFGDLERKNPRGYTLLMLAAYNGHIKIVHFLVSQGADVNSTDDSGNSILMGAAFKGFENIVEFLLNAGADKNYKNSKGQNAFQFSEMFGRKRVSELLSEKKRNRYYRFISFINSWFRYFTQTALKGGRQ